MTVTLRDRFGDRLEVYADRASWLAARAPHRIGGSDVAAILGVSAWAGSWDIYRRKALGIDEAVTAEKQALFDRGHMAEPAVLADYALSAGRELLDMPQCTIRHPDHDWLVGSPDGFAVDPELGLIGVEAKSAERVDGWGLQAEGVAEILPEDEGGATIVHVRPGDSGAGALPDTYLFQVLTYLEITGLPAWDVHLVAVPFGWWETVAELAKHVPWSRIAELAPEKGIHRRTVRVWRDEEAQAALVARIADWRERHLVRGEEPPLDGSEGCRATVHVPNSDKRVVEPPPEAAEDLAAWLEIDEQRRAAEATAKEAKDARAVVEARLCRSLGAAYAVTVPGGKLNHIRGTSAPTLDAKRLQAEHPEVYAEVVRPGKGFDYFRFYPSKK